MLSIATGKMETTQLISTVLKAKRALNSIGTSPFDGKDSVKGEDSDNLITDMKNYWLYMIAGAGVISGCKYELVFRCFRAYLLYN